MCGNVIAKIEAHRHFKLYMVLYNVEPRKGHFLSDIFLEKKLKQELERKPKQKISRLIDLLYRLNEIIRR